MPTEMENTPLLKMENIHKWFGTVHALKGVDVEVNAGEVVGIIGDNGAGKSTLVQHLLANLDTNYYHGLHIHYGGLQRTALLKTVGEQLGVETNTRAVPLLVKLQKHISMMVTGKHPVHPVILIDDAQLLERESLMDLCSLIVCPPKKRVNIVTIYTDKVPH